MNYISYEAYRAVEVRLRKRWTMRQKAEEALARARAKAVNISAPSGPGSSGGKGSKSGSRTERGALAVVRAEKRLETVRRWEAVFRKMDQIFPEDTNEGFVIGMIYGNGMTQAELARMCECSRQTVKMRQDRYVIRAAFLAAQMGLIREEVTMNGDVDSEK